MYPGNMTCTYYDMHIFLHTDIINVMTCTYFCTHTMHCTYFCTHIMHCTYFCPHVMHCADFARKYDHMHIILHIYYAHIMICTYFWTRILQMHILKILSIDIKKICLIQNFGHHQLKMSILKLKTFLEVWLTWLHECGFN